MALDIQCLAALNYLPMEIPIKEIAKKVGGVVALSKALGLSRGAVSQWRHVPIERVVAVEILTGIPRSLLRPDVFAEKPNTTDGLPANLQTKEAA